MRRLGLTAGLVTIVLLAALVVGAATGSYNRLVSLDQAVRAQWSQVENVYQRRLDLVPNLVATVKGAAQFERETLERVTAARGAAAASARGTDALDDRKAFENFEQAQRGLGTALGHLMVVVEAYPELRATQNFRDLQTQLEGTENRITVERMRFNEVSQRFNTYRQSFPTVVLVSVLAGRFPERPYFHAQTGAESAPQVQF
jgi:LemA protein